MNKDFMKLKFALMIFKTFIVSVSLTRCLNASKKDSYRLQKNISTSSVRVKKISQTQEISIANKLINERLEVVRGVFNPEVDPYIGRKILPEKCRQENLPKIIEIDDAKQIAKALSLYSSDNNIFGNCSTDNLMKTQYLILYCKKTGEIFGFTFYYKDELPWTQEPVARCE